MQILFRKRNLLFAMILCLDANAQAQSNNVNAKDSLNRDSLQLQEVVINGSRTERPVKLSPVQTQVIGGREMQEAGFSDFQQALQHETPGLNVQKVAFGSEMNLEGLDARHVLFLMDGERMTGDMAGNLDYERFNLHAIDRVEIVKGASSTLYGSRASGAVINIITKKTEDPLQVDAGIRWGQMNERNYHNPSKKDFLYMFEKNSDKPNLDAWTSVGTKQKWLTSQTDLWYSSRDAFYLYQKNNDHKVYTKEANPFLDKDIVVNNTFPRPPMGIEGSEHLTAAQKFYIDPAPWLSMQLYGSGFWMNTYDLVQDLVFTQSRDYTWGSKATWKLNDWFSLTGSIHMDYYDRYKRHERRDERKPVYHSRILEPKLILTSQYFNGHNITLGLDYCQDRLTSDRFVNRRMTSRSLNETEVYGEDEWTPSDHWMVSAGVRTNFSHQFGFMWMPKVAVKWSPDDRWAVRALYSKGYRSPSIKELFFNWDHLGMFMIKGNEYLKPEKNHYVSLGVEYATPDNKLYVNLNAYANFYHNKIEGVWRIYDLQYNFEYTNLSSQRMKGFDFIIRWKPWEWLTLNGNYSYVNISKENGLYINTTSPHAATASADFRKQLKKNWNLNVTLSSQIMGKKTYDVQDRVYVEKEGRSRNAYFRCELPWYSLTNLNVANTFYNKYRLSLGVENIFNYKPKTLGSGLTVFSVPATAGAKFYVQFEVKLNKHRKDEY